ncbi:structure-specific endonuclease subunit SLX4 [Octodon degus]|uniref:Structure-specific endonuclease subunit SLX4 n=1 Tax=Octodon degus TaxID=10160 RepID=A0A6P6E595_OCTDE|nr:structure-specific endonuclease subunit SLX4 [Octodon degus]
MCFITVEILENLSMEFIYQPESLKSAPRMDESDDDFKELCASFFQRVKKPRTKEVLGERKTQKSSNSTQIRSIPRKTKQSAIRSKTLPDTLKKPRPCSQAPRAKKQRPSKSQESEPALPVSGDGGVLAPALHQPVLQDQAQSIQTANALCDDSQPPLPCLMTAAEPSPSKRRTAELVLQRMQQFKRARPERLRHASQGCSLKATLEENDPQNSQEEMVAGNNLRSIHDPSSRGNGPGLPATDSDATVALVLQQEFGREGTSAQDDSLEEKGLFFCQMCQKNLSAMNVTRREQHVNRCLDEAEKALGPSMPQIPECPICGKPFVTSKSRISHLKQCAVKMEVEPQLLLQAVRMQTALPEAGSSPPAPSFSNLVEGWKRKRATNKKEPQKRRKISKPEVPSEDLLVAMALSRSEVEQGPPVPALRLESAFAERTRPGAGRKSRKRKLLVSPPQLLVQDSDTTGRQIEDRVAQLLSEEMELSSTPPLPVSKILREKLEETGWRLQLPEEKGNLLWEGSALTGAWAMESFYTAGLVPPIVPKRLTKVLTQEPRLTQSLPAHCSSSHAVCSPRDPSLSASQREQQALQDLVDLAEEGQSTSLWPCNGGMTSSGRAAGLDLVPSSLPLTGFALPPKEKPLERVDHTSLSLGMLAADFGAMVNNPHLSDVQFQTDSGDIVYAHKFVLYARCPLLIQYVNSEGFCAIEDGDETQRVLLSSVSTEATCVFLRFLYTADTGLPPHLAADLGTLAHRFGVSDLVHLCEQVPAVTDVEGERQEEEDETCESRAENFQELLRSIWTDEEEEAETFLKSEEEREKVNEADMEEIYEFAATQRKLLQWEKAPDTEEEPDQPGEDSPVVGPPMADNLGSKQLEKGEQLELLGPGKYKSPVHGENAGPSLLLPSGGCSDRAEYAEAPQQTAPKEVPGPSFCSPPGASEAGRGDVLVHSFEVPAYEQVFSLPQEFSEMSQIISEHQEQDDVKKKEVKMAYEPTPQPHPCCPAWLPSDRNPSRSQLHLHHTSDLSSSMPQSHNGVPMVPSPRLPSPSIPAEQDSNVLTVLKEPDHWKGRGCHSILECKSKGVLISPEKSLPIDLTQSVPDLSSSTSQDHPPHMSRENEVILLLDSDEELELEQTKTKLVSNGPSEEKNILEVSHKSPELFSVIDVDADQEHSQSPLRREAKLENGEGQLQDQDTVGSTRTSWLISDRDSSLDEDSTTDASWLVPATPVFSRSRDCSSQTQITSLRVRPPEDKIAQSSSRATPENSPLLEATQKFSVITPLMSPRPPGTSHRGRQVHSSPSHFQSTRHKLSFPRTSCPMAVGLPDFPGPVQKLSPKQAAVSEVVELGDSEDEQEAVSHQVNRSPQLDSDPPIPVDDCWNVEPLSPIPIDHLNLERTGPLSTSSPSSMAQEPQDSGGCHSAGLLRSTPIRARGRARRASSEPSSGSGSLGGSRLSFLNPALWDDWDEEGQKSPEAPPTPQTPRALRAQKSDGPETPKGANRKKNLPPKVPITPMPRYSIMETPVLKKELDRFGVRPLPKRQMVLKLKEIFQYTHQTLESDSEDEIQSSQVPRELDCSHTLPTETYKPCGVGGCTQLEATEGSSSKQSAQRRKKLPSRSIPHQRSRPPAEKPHVGPVVDTQLPASQESMATSVDSSDSSFSSQSSSGEFGAAFECAGDDEDEDGGLSMSQASRALDPEEAVRRYIRSKPELYRKVLTYQPLELAALQAELKQDGIRVAMGKLLDTLDTLCITFTTAAARKEKLKQKGQQRRGKKKGE